MSAPRIFVIAGPNGAGKSTVAATILPNRFPTERFLNADDIAKALATDSPLEAGRVMIRRMQELRERREIFAFESTLAGKTHVRFLSKAQEVGYLIHMAYVWLSNVELAKKRVSVRVQRGGHDIPPADIERRYWRGLKNFFRLYLPLANRWALCDNSGASLVLVARGRLGESPTIYDQARFDRKAMQPNETEERVLDEQLDEICRGLREAVDREVETLQREGFPIYISDNGRIVDLQQQQRPH